MKKLLSFLSLVILYSFLITDPLFSYTGEDEIIDSDIYEEMNKEKVEERLPRPAYGGWIIPRYTNLKSGDAKLSSVNNSTKIWAKIHFTDNIYTYIRFKDVYWKIITDDNISQDEDSSHLLDLDLAFLKFTLMDNDLNLFVGRKFYTLGSGITLNGRGDGSEISFYNSLVDLKILASYTGYLNKDNNPYGLSTKDFSDGSERLFGAINLSKTILNQEIFTYYLIQSDLNKENKDDNSTYDSQYFSLGLKGIIGDGSYFVEYIYQRGESHIASNNEKSDIKATGFNAGVQYFFSTVFNPTLLLGYSYASGDEDRSPENGGAISPNGNGKGDDNGFIAFGTFSAGLGLRPEFSNIQVFKAGLSVAPFRNFTILSYYYHYLKAEKNSPINSGEAELAELYIGQAIDFSIRWKIFEDFAVFADYGIFLPGDAYPDTTDNSQYYGAGIYLSF